MSDFLTRAACHGRRPHSSVPPRRLARPALIARLLRERHVARFIVSPDGYGKTDLALQYAETVFAFQHVFWIDCTSPCFLRDLDQACISDTLATASPDSFLAVFEDLPLLDSERAEQFSDEIDRMLDLGCEVLVTCVPACDAFERHCDRIKLSAFDLLVSNDELEELRSMGFRIDEPVELLSSAYRAIGLVSSSRSRAPFLLGAAHEELPADVQLALFILLTLHKGTFIDIAAFGIDIDDEMLRFAQNYPFLGIDLQQESFETVMFEPADIAAAFAARLTALVSRSILFERDALIIRLADLLVTQRQGERACEIVIHLASRTARATWLARQGWELFELACIWPACEVYYSLSGQLGENKMRIEVDEAVRRATLGDSATACRVARRVLESEIADVQHRLCAALVLSRCSEDNFFQYTEDLSAAGMSTEYESVLKQETRFDWNLVVLIHRALEHSSDKAAKIWVENFERGAHAETLMHMAAWILRAATLAKQEPEIGSASVVSASLERLAYLVRAKLSSLSETIGLADAVAGITFERACDQGILLSPHLDVQTASIVRRIELSLYAQRTTCDQVGRDRLERQRIDISSNSSSAVQRLTPDHVQGVISTSSVPLLTVNLFGGLDVRIGDDRVDPASFCRQKVRTLLALLVLNRGREFARDRLVTMLWPESDLVSARKNFYGTWSLLRHALMTQAGFCPYLIRQQQALRLDANLLVSDVMQYEEICRALLFERSDYGGWSDIFDQINDRFANDLMPSEGENSVIAGLRVDYRNRLIDALVSASTRLVQAGEVQEGLWFARAALQRDHTREDAYIALMRSQMAAGQRTAALDTFFAGQRTLAEELGIDPSAEMRNLHRAIITAEDPALLPL